MNKFASFGIVTYLLILSGCSDIAIVEQFRPNPSPPKPKYDFSSSSNLSESDFERYGTDTESEDSEPESLIEQAPSTIEEPREFEPEPIDDVSSVDVADDSNPSNSHDDGDILDGFEPLDTDFQFVNSMRMWKDSNTKFTTTAELIGVDLLAGEIRLLKENGMIINVPYFRLSKHDQNFVRAYLTTNSCKTSFQIKMETTLVE